MNPIDAIAMASKNCFDYYKMGNELGGIGPGKIADILILDDYKKIKINKVILRWKNYRFKWKNFRKNSFT